MLRNFLAAITVFCLACTSATAADDKPVELKVGDKAPKFEAKTDQDKAWKSTDYVGEKVLVVYFYPKDMTPGCTKQACSYRDLHEQFDKKEVEVIGISGDSVASHQEFKKAHDLNFTLLADEKGEIAKAFGVKLLASGPSVIPARWTFVIDQDGKIAYKDDEVDATKDAEQVMKAVDKLADKKS